MLYENNVNKMCAKEQGIRKIDSAAKDDPKFLVLPQRVKKAVERLESGGKVPEDLQIKCFGLIVSTTTLLFSKS